MSDSVLEPTQYELRLLAGVDFGDSRHCFYAARWARATLNPRIMRSVAENILEAQKTKLGHKPSDLYYLAKAAEAIDIQLFTAELFQTINPRKPLISSTTPVRGPQALQLAKACSIFAPAVDPLDSTNGESDSEVDDLFVELIEAGWKSEHLSLDEGLELKPVSVVDLFVEFIELGWTSALPLFDESFEFQPASLENPRVYNLSELADLVESTQLLYSKRYRTAVERVTLGVLNNDLYLDRGTRSIDHLIRIRETFIDDHYIVLKVEVAIAKIADATRADILRTSQVRLSDTHIERPDKLETLLQVLHRAQQALASTFLDRITSQWTTEHLRDKPNAGPHIFIEFPSLDPSITIDPTIERIRSASDSLSLAALGFELSNIPEPVLSALHEKVATFVSSGTVSSLPQAAFSLEVATEAEDDGLAAQVIAAVDALILEDKIQRVSTFAELRSLSELYPRLSASAQIKALSIATTYLMSTGFSGPSGEMAIFEVLYNFSEPVMPATFAAAVAQTDTASWDLGDCWSLATQIAMGRIASSSAVSLVTDSVALLPSEGNGLETQTEAVTIPTFNQLPPFFDRSNAVTRISAGVNDAGDLDDLAAASENHPDDRVREACGLIVTQVRARRSLS